MNLNIKCVCLMYLRLNYHHESMCENTWGCTCGGCSATWTHTKEHGKFSHHSQERTRRKRTLLQNRFSKKKRLLFNFIVEPTTKKEAADKSPTIMLPGKTPESRQTAQPVGGAKAAAHRECLERSISGSLPGGPQRQVGDAEVPAGG